MNSVYAHTQISKNWYSSPWIMHVSFVLQTTIELIDLSFVVLMQSTMIMMITMMMGMLKSHCFSSILFYNQVLCYYFWWHIILTLSYIIIFQLNCYVYAHRIQYACIPYKYKCVNWIKIECEFIFKKITKLLWESVSNTKSEISYIFRNSVKINGKWWIVDSRLSACKKINGRK